VKDTQLELMSACGHWPQREDTVAFNRILLRYLSREA
jgi:pimeloyl-ACP methyl ester carboxylesterase